MASPKKNEKEKDFKYLVIVESPAKSKTLTKILGAEFLVKSSIGHIRDLPAKGIGIDVKNNFEPTYEIMHGKQKVVDELNQYAKKAEKIYLASDPDREGEAIAWHLSNILNSSKKNIVRVAFNQITPNAVRAAVEHPRDIDKELVEAQQARRLLDRLVGYKISPILWRKIGGRSAGRVQSVAVRLVCEREEEVRSFVPEEYWTVKSEVEDTTAKSGESFFVHLTHVDSKKLMSPAKEVDNNKHLVIRSKTEVEQIMQRIAKASLSVSDLSTRSGTKNPKPPFKTSTLQRAASNALGFTVKRTMQVAQSLYEGVKLGSDDQVGLITYMRTDSLRLAPESLEMAKDYILNKWGAEYYPGEATQYNKSKKKVEEGESKKQNEQDAHEAIRPTYIDKSPELIKKHLTDEQYKIYKLIWERFVSCQMSPMKTETNVLEISSAQADLILRASQTKKVFPGFSIVFESGREIGEDMEESEQDSKFPPSIKVGNQISVLETVPAQHFTEGPPRYNEASLVKTLEELGIGRPSTYAPTIATILDRKYVEKAGGNALMPTKLGISVNNLLVTHFGKYINVDYTSKMEADLDRIANAEGPGWIDMLNNFYWGPSGPPKPKPKKSKSKKTAAKSEKKTDKKTETNTEQSTDELGFADIVKKASKEIENVVIPTDHKCPKCGSIMNLKSSRYGPFLGCSNYPDCQTIINITKDGTPAPPDRPYLKESCPKCLNSSLVIKYGRYGDYLACSTDDCKYTSPLVKKLGIKCPRESCPGEIVEKKSRFNKIFYGCNSWSETKCETVFWYQPINEKCPKCDSLLMYKTLKRGDKIACSDTKGCGYDRLATVQEQEKYKSILGEEEGEQKKSVFSLT